MQPSHSLLEPPERIGLPTLTLRGSASTLLGGKERSSRTTEWPNSAAPPYYPLMAHPGPPVLKGCSVWDVSQSWEPNPGPSPYQGDALPLCYSGTASRHFGAPIDLTEACGQPGIRTPNSWVQTRRDTINTSRPCMPPWLPATQSAVRL